MLLLCAYVFTFLFALSDLYLVAAVADEIKWVSSNHLSEWFQPWELCILNTSSADIGKKDLMHKCMKDMGADKDNSRVFHCRAGGAYHGNSCWEMDPSQHSFKERVHLTSAVAGYDDPGQRHLQYALASAARQNASLLLLGDSLMYQFGVAFTCELRRKSSILDDRPMWKSDFPVPSIQLQNPTRVIPSDLVRYDIFQQEDGIGSVLRSRLDEFLRVSRRVFVLISGGAHSNHRDIMKIGALRTLRLMHSISELNPNVVFMYMETPATHFNTSNGYWKHAQTPCVPILDPSPEADWRNYIVHQYIREYNLTSIRIVHLRKLTEPLYREHVLGNFKDCTHYCWTPMMYQYVFAQIANIVESAEAADPVHNVKAPAVDDPIPTKDVAASSYRPLKPVGRIVSWQQFVHDND